VLAIVASLYGTSAIFSYDMACAVVITAVVLGVAATFARSSGRAILLALGLLVSHWFDYAHCGYFGKLIAYPAMLFVCGLTLNALRAPSAEQALLLMVLSAAVGTMHSGAATTFVSLPILATALVAMAIWRDDRTMLSSAMSLCGIVVATPLFASGVLSRPLMIKYPDYELQWSYIVPRVLDLENQGISLSGMSPAWVEGQVAVAVLVWSALVGLAIIGRNARATALLGGPAVLLIGIVTVGAGATAFQLIGYFYPAIVCGALALAADTRATKAIVMALALLNVAQRLPRFAGALDRYALHQSQQNLFSAAELDRLARDIGKEAVRIDVPEPVPGILLLVELGRRHLDLDWSQRAWDIIIGYRHWPLPVRDNPPTMDLRVSNDGPFVHFALERPPDR
jgi:hypothetical protein